MQTKMKGFSLIEVILVLVIASAIIYLGLGYIQQRTLRMRIDRVNFQMQQITSAALSYYVTNNLWPPSLTCLQGRDVDNPTCDTYLPQTLISPWTQPYQIGTLPGDNVFFVSLTLPAVVGRDSIAQVIAGTLPLSRVDIATGTIYAYVNAASQNLNNATAVNSAGMYHHGACVPVPTCPVDSKGNTMRPIIMVMPVSVAGVNDNGADRNNVYPISSFTAYAQNDSPTDNTAVPTTVNPKACAHATIAPTCYESNGSLIARGYWRVCLQVITENGEVALTRNEVWGDQATLLAITRCVPKDESGGSTLEVYSN